MPIEVHCPNPTCAKTHAVKEKYARARAKCPACQSWMYVPAPLSSSLATMMPSGRVPVPAIDDAPPAPPPVTHRPSAPPPISLPPTAPPRKAAPLAEPPRADEPSLWHDEAATAAPSKPPRREAPPPVEEEEVAEAAELAEEEEQEAPKKPKSKRHFSVVAVILLLLGSLSLGGIAAAPFLSPPSIEKSGELADLLPNPQGMKAEGVPILLGVAGLVALFGVTSLLTAVFTRRMNFATLFPLYLALIGSATLLLFALTWMADAQRDKERAERRTAEYREKGTKGDATSSMGLQFYAMAGGAAGACFFFVLAGVFMHRRIWSKLLGFTFLSFWPTLAVVWTYHRQLGIDEWPLEVPGLK